MSLEMFCVLKGNMAGRRVQTIPGEVLTLWALHYATVPRRQDFYSHWFARPAWLRFLSGSCWSAHNLRTTAPSHIPVASLRRGLHLL